MDDVENHKLISFLLIMYFYLIPFYNFRINNTTERVQNGFWEITLNLATTQSPAAKIRNGSDRMYQENLQQAFSTGDMVVKKIQRFLFRIFLVYFLHILEYYEV